MNPPGTAPAEAIDNHTLEADYFDGRSARARAARLQVVAGQLRVLPAAAGDFEPVTLPVQDVEWPERQRHGPRLARLPGGASLQGRDGPRWDAWARAAGLAESRVVRAQQSWRATAWACAVLVVLCVAGYLWGVPAGTRLVVALLPSTIDQQVGRAAFDSLDGDLFKPSALPAERQQALREHFERAARAAYAPSQPPSHRVLFRAGKLGPNALALPDGTIVFTDDMVKLFEADADRGDPVLVGVFAHELGHVQHRHGMRGIVQASLVGTATAVAFGDFSTLLAGVPAMLGQLGYSRDFEREADEASIRAMRADGTDPAAMIRLFDALAKVRDGGKGSGLGIALSSHPADEERVRRFRDASRGLPAAPARAGS